MKNIKQVVKSTLMAGVLALFSQASFATMLTVEVADQPYQVGDLVTADIVISDIEQVFGIQREIGAFNFDLTFDNSAVANSQVTFGSLLNVGLFGSSQNVTDNGSSLTVDEFSFADAFELFGAQGSVTEFVLASVQFELTSAGTVDFSLANVSLSDALGSADAFLPASLTLQGASFTVNPAQVPAPASAALILLPLLLLSRKRFS